MTVPLSDKTRDAAAKLIARYPVARSALLPLLHLVQSDQGHVTEEGLAFCAEQLGLTKAEVGAVATFYTMFKREPVGDYLLSVCTNPTCQIAGAQQIYERYKSELGGHHDPESGVSVEHAECLGICDAAPVVQINYEMYGPMDDAQADALLAGCKKGEPPVSPWSGEAPKTFKEVEWELSGAADGIDDQLIEAARHQVTGYHVPPSYRTGETDIPVTHPGGDPAGHGGDVFRERTAATEAVEQTVRDRTTRADSVDADVEAPADSAAEERAQHVRDDVPTGDDATPDASKGMPVDEPGSGDDDSGGTSPATEGV